MLFIQREWKTKFIGLFLLLIMGLLLFSSCASENIPVESATSFSPIATPQPEATPNPPTTTPVPAPTSEPTDTPTLEPTLVATTLPTQEPTATSTAEPPKINLSSTAFESGAMIPEPYTRDGGNMSPPLEWSDPPEGVQSFALLVESDPVPDGGGPWTQWLLYNIPAETRALPEALIPDEAGLLPDGSRHHPNSWGNLEYGGPAPPQFETYRYYFQIYALDTTLDLELVKAQMQEEGTLPWIGASRAVLDRAMEGHILAQGELIGKYKGDAP